jgi:murein DD-endopeptidase MepM/ murein hydrolase activator NlpD
MSGRFISQRISGLAAVLAIPLAACAGGNTPRAQLVPAPASYFTATVQPADTVSAIAERYRVREDDLLAMNEFGSGKQPRAGDRIRIPAYASLASVRPQAKSVPTAPDTQVGPPSAAAPKAAPTTRVQVSQATPLPKAKPNAPKTEAPKRSSWFDMDWLSSFSPEQPDPKVNATFLWPLKGQVISTFGPAATGARNDGINISAMRGDSIYAAGDGTVTYVGNELKGYGNLILIQHDNGFITAYAHSETVKVVRGQHVAKGDVIAYAGATGDVTEPQLHFELRYGTKPINPQPYLVASK